MKTLLAYIIYIPMLAGLMFLLALLLIMIASFDLANWAMRRVEG